MGCGESKNARGAEVRGGSSARGCPLLDTPEEQANRFLQLCGPPSLASTLTSKSSTGAAAAHSRKHTAAGSQKPLFNPLAVELRRVYTETRQRVLEQQLGDEAAMNAKKAKEREERVQRVHARRITVTAGASSAEVPPPVDSGTAGAAATASSNAGSTTNTEVYRSVKQSPVLPPVMQRPAQEEFCVYVTDSLQEAQQIHFTAFDVVEAVEVFGGYVKQDLLQQQRAAIRENQSKAHKSGRARAGSSGGGGSGAGARHLSLTDSSSDKEAAAVAAAAAGTPPPSVPWTCRMQCRLSGKTAKAEALLDAARQRWCHEREASHQKASSSSAASPGPGDDGKRGRKRDREGKRKKEPAPRPTSANEPLHPGNDDDAGARGDEKGGEAESGGDGLLFIDAVFESTVPGSFDHRTPWQLELLFFFAA